jgi:hypothetical protein
METITLEKINFAVLCAVTALAAAGFAISAAAELLGRSRGRAWGRALHMLATGVAFAIIFTGMFLGYPASLAAILLGTAAGCGEGYMVTWWEQQARLAARERR